jgi:hypothetical protein
MNTENNKPVKIKKTIALLFFILFWINAHAFEFTSYKNPPIDTTKAFALTQKVENEGRFINSCEDALAVYLPQGISKKIGEQEYILVLESMSFSPEGAKLTAYMSVEVPKSEKRISLKGSNINFAPDGFTGGARLELGEDADFSIGENLTLVLKGDMEQSKTYVDCDCDGYKEMGLDGEIQFNRDKFIPVDENGEISRDPYEKVSATFETRIASWDDLIIDVGISPFQIAELKDFNFSVNHAVFDFSEQANSPIIEFPRDYKSSDFTDGNQLMWKGFFLKDLVVRLPKTFNRKDGKRSTIEAHNLLIDNIGLSGIFMATNIFSLNEGEMDKWGFSLDELSANITKNQLVSCGFKGTINVPPLGESANLGYEAFIDPGNQYNFKVITNETLNMDIWAAKISLEPNSYVEINVIDDKFYPRAVLNGQLAVNANKVELANVDFEELAISTRAPYMKVKAFSFGSEVANQKLGNFPIGITNVGLITENDRTGLQFDLRLNLVKEGSGGFSGETGLVLYARQYEENNRTRWKYDGFDVRRIKIDINGGAFKLNGSALFFKDDPLYGDGFNGNLTAKYEGLAELEATAVFGNTGKFRYFYTDGLIDLEKGIPIFSGVNLYSFGGGLYHNMRRMGYNETSTSQIGMTKSGIVYKPDEKTAFGFKATVGIGLTSKEAFNADLTLEMAFNKNAGVDRILFEGNGYFMTPPIPTNVQKVLDKCKKLSKDQDPNGSDEKETGSRSCISAHTSLDFDFRNRVTHGNLSVYINLPGDIIKGIGPEGKAGEAVMHFAPNEWYIHIGKPTDRIGIKVLNLASLNSYFMMGTNIPGSPPPPARVSKILGDIDLDYMGDLNQLGEGKGIAFGAGLELSTGDLKFPPFYARFDAGIGFDVMMKNYGNVSCKGQSEALGINGWYANGQVWAYLEGDIGIKIDWRFIKGKYQILSVGAAAVLQAKLPNPFWMRGIVGGRYSILGGLVKGNCRFEFEIGEQCEIEGNYNPMQNVEIISEITPNDGSSDVNVFNAPQAVFNMPIGKVFDLADMDGNKLSYKVQLDHFKILDDGKEIQGTIKYNDEKDVLIFDSYEVLPPEKSITADVQVSFKEKKNGTWETLTIDGNAVIENRKVTFKTGKAPDFIPLSNVKYSYPLPMMFNYYQNETDIGYIQLKKGQEYLFNPGIEWKQVGCYEEKQGKRNYFYFNYNASERKISFTQPGGLRNNAIYGFKLINVPASSMGEIDKNVTAITTPQNGGNVEITTKIAEGTIDLLQEKNIFETHFRTSKYNTFSTKIDNLSMGQGSLWAIRALVHEISKSIYAGEKFDKYETEGDNEISQLIECINILDNKTWYKELIYPYTYENYPLANSIYINNREIFPVGIPPERTMKISILKGTENLNEADLLNGTPNTETGLAKFKSTLVDYCERDYSNLAIQACAKFWNSPDIDSDIKYLIVNSFPPVRKGDYRFKLNYVLPGTNVVTSTKELTITLDY